MTASKQNKQVLAGSVTLLVLAMQVAKQRSGV